MAVASASDGSEVGGGHDDDAKAADAFAAAADAFAAAASSATAGAKPNFEDHPRKTFKRAPPPPLHGFSNAQADGGLEDSLLPRRSLSEPSAVFSPADSGVGTLDRGTSLCDLTPCTDSGKPLSKSSPTSPPPSPGSSSPPQSLQRASSGEAASSSPLAVSFEEAARRMHGWTLMDSVVPSSPNCVVGAFFGRRERNAAAAASQGKDHDSQIIASRKCILCVTQMFRSLQPHPILPHPVCPLIVSITLIDVDTRFVRCDGRCH